MRRSVPSQGPRAGTWRSQESIQGPTLHLCEPGSQEMAENTDSRDPLRSLSVPNTALSPTRGLVEAPEPYGALTSNLTFPQMTWYSFHQQQMPSNEVLALPTPRKAQPSPLECGQPWLSLQVSLRSNRGTPCLSPSFCLPTLAPHITPSSISSTGSWAVRLQQSRAQLACSRWSPHVILCLYLVSIMCSFINQPDESFSNWS